MCILYIYICTWQIGILYTPTDCYWYHHQCSVENQMIALGSVSASIIMGGKLNIHQPEKPCNKKNPETRRTSITSYSNDVLKVNTCNNEGIASMAFWSVNPPWLLVMPAQPFGASFGPGFFPSHLQVAWRILWLPAVWDNEPRTQRPLVKVKAHATGHGKHTMS